MTFHRKAVLDGLRVFYREAGPRDAPAIVLCHAKFTPRAE